MSAQSNNTHRNPARFGHRRFTVLASLVLYVFLILVATNLVAGIIFSALSHFGIVRNQAGGPVPFSMLLLLLSSILIGTGLTAMASRRPLKPFQILTEATQQIAAGNFDVRVEPRGPHELQQLAESFNSMAKELGSIETLRSDFVNNVSHEFKTPVVSIKGFAKLLKKKSLSEESRQEYLDVIIMESERLSKLSGNVLLLSKLEKQDIVEEIAPFSLDEQVRRSILLLEPQCRRKGLTLNVDMEPVTFQGNAELLHHVWINLLSNAVKFTEPGGTIMIRMWAVPNEIIVEFTDTGVGMEEDVANHLFDKFYQGDKSHATEGNGLGLSLAKRIVELSEGNVAVHSIPGEGSTFTVILPRYEPA